MGGMTHPSSSQPSRIVIIGGSLAGGSAAITLRDHGYQGELTLIGEESQLPYERPPLSKAVLIGNTDEPDWVADEAAYADKNITLRLGTTATRIDRARKVVVASGTEYPYDKLLIATGSAPRRLDVPGADLDGLLTLRTLEESLALRERFTEGAAIVIVGGGWIGCEAAAAARQHGANVTVIEPRSQPLLPVVGEQVGASFAALHRDHVAVEALDLIFVAAEGVLGVFQPLTFGGKQLDQLDLSARTAGVAHWCILSSPDAWFRITSVPVRDRRSGWCRHPPGLC